MTRDTQQAKAARQTLFSDMVLSIAGSADLDLLLSDLVDKLKETTDFERCTLALLNADQGIYRLRVLHESRGGYSRDSVDSISTDGIGNVGRCRG